MAMATGAVHHALVKAGLRTKVGLALEAGDCRDVHHAAVLIGYGAGAVCPWLALQTARALAGEEGEARLLKALQRRPGQGDVEDGHLRPRQLSGCATVRRSRTRRRGYRPAASPAPRRRWEDGTSPTSKPRFARRGRRSPKLRAARLRMGALPPRRRRRTAHLAAAAHARSAGRGRRSARVNTQAAATLAPAEAWSAYARAVDEREPAVLRDLLEINAAGPQLRTARSRAAVQPGEALHRQRHVAGLAQSRGAPDHHPRHEPAGRALQHRRRRRRSRGLPARRQRSGRVCRCATTRSSRSRPDASA